MDTVTKPRVVFVVLLAAAVLAAGCAGGLGGFGDAGNLIGKLADGIDLEADGANLSVAGRGTGTVTVDAVGTFTFAARCNALGLSQGPDRWEPDIVTGPGTGPNGEAVHIYFAWSKLWIDVLFEPGSPQIDSSYQSDRHRPGETDQWDITVDGPHITGHAVVKRLDDGDSGFSESGLAGPARFAVDCGCGPACDW